MAPAPGGAIFEQRHADAPPSRVHAEVLERDRTPAPPVSGLLAGGDQRAPGEHRAGGREAQPAFATTRAQRTAAALLRLRGVPRRLPGGRGDPPRRRPGPLRGPGLTASASYPNRSSRAAWTIAITAG